MIRDALLNVRTMYLMVTWKLCKHFVFVIELFKEVKSNDVFEIERNFLQFLEVVATTVFSKKCDWLKVHPERSWENMGRDHSESLYITCTL